MKESKNRPAEIARKLDLVRRHAEGRAVRLRGIDWFAWITAGGSSAVLLAAETGVAEVVVTDSDAWVVTDTIEAGRLQQEELPDGISIHACRWAYPREREAFIRDIARGAAVASDRPQAGEDALSEALVRQKRLMSPGEASCYREVGALATQAMTEVLVRAAPEWTELQLAGAGAEALLCRGLDPALVMAAGERRLRLYRHPMPKDEPLGSLAMLVFCARGHGLYANLTRFVSFGPLSSADAELHRHVREVESAALAASRPGTSLGKIYRTLADAYAAHGFAGAIGEHHQGGTTGYLSREIVATPDTCETLGYGSAVAWNPSITGAKVEDTFLVTDTGLENVTLDQEWPTVPVLGINRPLVLER